MNAQTQRSVLQTRQTSFMSSVETGQGHVSTWSSPCMSHDSPESVENQHVLSWYLASLAVTATKLDWQEEEKEKAAVK